MKNQKSFPGMVIINGLSLQGEGDRDKDQKKSGMYFHFLNAFKWIRR
jgi:hypothetical protein